jgi:pyridoxal/pyridoxine/pyridoxamine kinase
MDEDPNALEGGRTLTVLETLRRIEGLLYATKALKQRGKGDLMSALLAARIPWSFDLEAFIKEKGGASKALAAVGYHPDVITWLQRNGDELFTLEDDERPTIFQAWVQSEIKRQTT